MPQFLHTTDLWYTAGSSDKEYHAQIRKDGPNSYSVPFSYGRRDNAYSGGEKCTGATYPKARQTYISLVKSKMRKGYVPNESGQPFATDMAVEEWEASVPMNSEATPVVVQPTVAEHIEVTTTVTASQSRPVPQLLNMIEEEQMLALIEDSAWGAQEKYDGKRMTLEWSFYPKKGKQRVTAFNKKGKECPHPQHLDMDVLSIAASESLENLVLDGELVDGVFHVFDILSFEGTDDSAWGMEDCRKESYTDRYTRLQNMIADLSLNKIKLAPLAVTPKEKKNLLKRLRKNGKEGIVFKKLDSPYTSGRPNSGGDQLKFKFYATASVIINKVNEKNSVNMMVLDENGHEVIVGNCTVPAKEKPNLYEGIIFEVRYLYAYPGGSLYQPNYLGIRDDVDREECVITQLKYKNQGQDEKEEIEAQPQRRILWK